MLHLFAESRLSAALIERIAGSDAVLLQAGCVWAAWRGHEDNFKIQALLQKSCAVYALQDVLLAQGISAEQLLAGVQVIDYAGFVDLTLRHPVIHTWY